MMNANHTDQDDLYLFALQLLPDAEMNSIALHLRGCESCKLQLGQIQGDLVAYAMTAEMQAPAVQARARLLEQVAKEKKVIPISQPEKQAAQPGAPVRHVEPLDRQAEPVLYARNSRMFQMDAPEERERRRLAPFMAWTGWAVAAAAAVAAGLQYQQQKLVQQNLSAETALLKENNAQTAQARQVMQALTDKSAMQVSLHVPLTRGLPPKLDPEAHATYIPGQGSLVFVASHLDPLMPSKTYELWLLPAEAGVAPVPAGLFKPDMNGNATLLMPELPKGMTAKGFGVTVENDGGSKTPTAPIVLAGM